MSYLPVPMVEDLAGVLEALGASASSPPLTVHPVPRWRGRNPRVTSGYGPRSGGMYDTHYGNDILLPGAPGEWTTSPDGLLSGSGHWVMPSGSVAALAAGDGVVTKAGWTSTGDRVAIQHDDRWSTGYMHLRKPMVRVGQTVRAGQPLGIISYSPWVSGCTSTPEKPCKVGLNHLHFELYDRGSPVDPEAHLGSQLSALTIIDNPLGLELLLYLGLAGFVAWGGYRLLR